MLVDGNLHIVATDAHGQRSRRPLLRRAFERVRELADTETAIDLFCRHPQCVADGREVVVRRQTQRRKVFFPAWLGWRRAG
jgi:tyrosine-protein phosphatase YwqE